MNRIWIVKLITICMVFALILGAIPTMSGNGSGSCDLTVTAPENTKVYIYKGNTLITSGTITGGTSKIFTIDQYASYKVRLRQGSADFYFEPVDCSGTTATLDKLCELTVAAPAGTAVYVYRGNAQVTSGTCTSSITFDVVQYNAYKVRLRQGSADFYFEPIDCSGATASMDKICQLSVTAPAGTQVYVYRGNAQVTSGTCSSTAVFEVVMYNDYKIRLRQGSADFYFFGIDCSGTTHSEDWTSQLTVTAPAGTKVYVNRGNAQVTSGTATTGTIILDVVQYNAYKVRLRQGSADFYFEPIDCSGATQSINKVCQLTVIVPAGTKVYVNRGNAEVTSGTAITGTITLDVVQYNAYKVRLRQGSADFYFEPIDCSGATQSMNKVCQLTVTAPAGTKVYVNRGNAQVTSGTATTGTITLDVVQYNAYKVRLRQGSADFYFEPVDCSGATHSVNYLCKLTVPAPAGAKVYVYKGNAQVTSGTASSSITLDVVKYNDYTVRVRYNNKDYYFYNVDCTSCPTTLSSTLTVKFDGMKLNQVQIRTTGGSLVTYKNWVTNEVTFELDYGMYDVVLKHGAKTKTVEDIYVLGTVTLDDLVCELTVEFPGIKLNQVQIRTTSNGLVTYKNWVTDEWTVNLLKNTYDVVMKEGAKTKTVEDVDCTGDYKVLSANVCELTIEFPGMKLNQVQIRTTSNGLVKYKNWITDEWVVPVLKNTYTVVLKHGAKTKYVYNVDCTGDTATVDNIVCTLTVNFPGMKLNQVQVRTTSNGLVTYKNWQTDSCTFTLLRNTYDVILKHGAKTLTVEDVDCTGATATVTDITCTLTINFPGMKLNQVQIRTTSNGLVTYKNWQTDSCTFILLRNTYDVILKHGAKTLRVDNVDCTGATATLTDITCTLTINFPGMKLNQVQIRTWDTNGLVTYKNWQTDSCTFVLLRNTYDIILKHGAKTKRIEDVDCTSATKTVSGITCTLTLGFQGFKMNQVQIRTWDTNGLVTYKNWPQDSITFVLLQNTYDIIIKYGSLTYRLEDVNCNCASKTLDKGPLKINAPHGTQVKVYKKDTTTLVASGTCTSSQWVTFNNMPNGIYDIFLKQNAKEKTLEDVWIFISTSLDELCILKVNAPHGTYVEVRTPVTTNKVTSGITTSSQWVTLYVVKNTYDVFLKQNAKEYTETNVDCTGETQSIDNLCVLKVKAPHGTYVEVQKNCGKVTSGTTTSSQWVTLYVVKNTYNIYLKQNAKEKTLTGIDCTGDTKSIDEVCELKVKAPHGTYVEVQKNCGKVTSGTTTSSQWVTLYVVKNTYDIYLKQNAKDKTVSSVDCTGATKSIDEVCKLTVKAPHGTYVEVRTLGTTNKVTSGTTTSSQWVTLYVVKNTYDIYLKQNAKDKTVSSVDCTGATKSIDEVCKLTVKAPHGSLIKVYVAGTTNLVTSGTTTSSQWVTLYVVKNTYDIEATISGTPTTHYGVDCTGSTKSDTFI